MSAINTHFMALNIDKDGLASTGLKIVDEICYIMFRP